MIDLDKILSQVETDLISKLSSIDLLSLSDLEFQQLFAQIELLGYDRLFSAIEADNVSKVNELRSLAESKGVSFDAGRLEVYERLIDVNVFQARKASEYHLSQVFSAAVYGNMNGLSTNEIIKRIPSDLPFSKSQLVAEIDQTISKYNATVTADIFDEPDQRFKLAGPIDDRKRCQCLAVILNQPKEGWTKAQIDAGAATKVARANCPKYEGKYTWLDRGSYNCRDYWEAQ